MMISVCVSSTVYRFRGHSKRSARWLRRMLPRAYLTRLLLPRTIPVIGTAVARHQHDGNKRRKTSGNLAAWSACYAIDDSGVIDTISRGDVITARSTPLTFYLIVCSMPRRLEDFNFDNRCFTVRGERYVSILPRSLAAALKF